MRLAKDKIVENQGSKIKVMGIIAVLVALLAVIGFQLYQMVQMDQVNVPFDSKNPLTINYDNLKWGTFRSGVYFGMKTLTPDSLVTGLMWFKNKIEHNTLGIRHWCSQHDGISKYGWKKHNFHDFGIQEIIDGNLLIKTSFVVKGQTSWSAKVDFKRINESIKYENPISLIYYVGTENGKEWTADDGKIRNDTFRVLKKRHPYPVDEPFYVKGNSHSTGDFDLKIDVSEHSENVLFKGFLGTKTSPPLVYLKETVLQNMLIVPGQEREDLFVVRGSIAPDSNWIAHQIIFRPPLTLNVEYGDDVTEKSTEQSSQEFDALVKEKSAKFDQEFEQRFNMKSNGFNEIDTEIAQSIVSNMIGSVGFSHGYSTVQSKSSDQASNKKELLYGPLSLLSGVPSRSFFPRGFLWDEGFHGLVISKANPELSVQIVKSWLNLMNVEGWIPREVILGPESEARVPAEFVVQRNTNANPPALLLTIESLIQQKKISRNDLEDMFPRLQAWYNWYNTSQAGDRPGTYRWRGRDPNPRHELNPKTLTSGLDDYPRASHPTKDEYHIDLYSWMTLASRAMAKIATVIESNSVASYEETYKYLQDEKLMTQLHWSDQYKIFCDRGLHSLQVKLQKPLHQPDLPSIRIEQSPPEFGCVPEIGYVSLFPFLLQILDPKSDKLPLIMDDMSDPNRLWTKYGLRSLSKFSRYYKKYNTDSDPPYWRGAIWIQMNYLALKSLNYYSNQNECPYRLRAKELYTKLRDAVVNNILDQYKRTGYVWENYDDTTGKGQGSHPFTGWTALVVLIMAEEY